MIGDTLGESSETLFFMNKRKPSLISYQQPQNPHLHYAPFKGQYYETIGWDPVGQIKPLTSQQQQKGQGLFTTFILKINLLINFHL